MRKNTTRGNGDKIAITDRSRRRPYQGYCLQRTDFYSLEAVNDNFLIRYHLSEIQKKFGVCFRYKTHNTQEKQCILVPCAAYLAPHFDLSVPDRRR